MTGSEPPADALIEAARAARALLADRMAAAGDVLSRPPGFGIDDEARARAGLLVEQVLDAIERALVAAEPALDTGAPGVAAARFGAAGLLGGSGLAAAAVLRAEEHRLSAALIRGAEAGEEIGPGPRRLDPIGGTLAAESYAMHAAEAARIDRVGDPLLPLHDIAAEDRHILFQQVAACLADAALALQGQARAGGAEAMHRAAAGAVARGLAAIDDGDGVAAAALALARALDQEGMLDDALLAGTLASGRVATLAGMLAVRAGVPFDEARAMLTAPTRCAVLLRAGRVARPVAPAMIVALTLALDRGFGPDPGEFAADIVEQFDALPFSRAAAEVRASRLDPVYRAALAALGDGG